MFGYFLTAPVVGKNMALLVFNVSDLALPMNLEHKPMKSEKIFLYEKIGHEVKSVVLSKENLLHGLSCQIAI